MLIVSHARGDDVRFTKPQSVLLDLARGVSAQIVLFGHVTSLAGLQNPGHLYQNLGVVVFFVLSGLLVTHSVLNKPKEYGFADYMIDRGARIFVPYVPAIIFIGLCSIMLHLGGPTDPVTVVSNLLMLEDFPLGRYVSWFPEFDRIGTGRPLWSVAVEWWFYIAAAAFYFVGRLPRLYWLLAPPALIVAIYNATIGALAITWIAGAVIALLFFRLPRLSQTETAMLFVATLSLCGLRLFLVRWNFYDLQFALLLAISLVAALKLVENWNWLEQISRPIAGLAAFSYTLYLTHNTVIDALRPLHGLVYVIVGFSAANLIAIAMWWLFERHHKAVAEMVRSKLRSCAMHSTHGGSPAAGGEF